MLGYLNHSISSVHVVNDDVVVIGNTNAGTIVNVLSMADGKVKDEFFVSSRASSATSAQSLHP